MFCAFDAWIHVFHSLCFSVVFPEHVFWVCSWPTLTSASRFCIISRVKSATQNLVMVCFGRQVK